MIWMGTKEHYGEDQKLLEKLYWPRVKLDAVIHFQLFFTMKLKLMIFQQAIHDSYHCERDWGSVPIKPFPTQRIPQTIFATDRNGSQGEWTRPGPCPIACRPEHHKEWTFCWKIWNKLVVSDNWRLFRRLIYESDVRPAAFIGNLYVQIFFNLSITFVVHFNWFYNVYLFFLFAKPVVNTISREKLAPAKSSTPV